MSVKVSLETPLNIFSLRFTDLQQAQYSSCFVSTGNLDGHESFEDGEKGRTRLGELFTSSLKQPCWREIRQHSLVKVNELENGRPLKQNRPF